MQQQPGCPSCGTPYVPGADLFCGVCGAALPADVTAPIEPSPPPPPGPSGWQPTEQYPPYAAEPPYQTPQYGSEPPYQPPPYDPGPQAGEPARKRNLVPIIAGALALIVAVGAFVVLSGGEASANEVLLESKLSPGQDPFEDITPDPDEEPETITAVPRVIAGVNPQPTPTVSSTGSPAVSPTGESPGPPPSTELYGGTGKLSQCSKRQLLEFLEANPDKAKAWAGVFGITVEEIPAFVESLLPAELNLPTRVTNHGFKDGKATPIQSALEPGTAVLVDAEGGLRVRCKCGNPLAPPQPVDDPIYVGDWPDFDPEDLVSPPSPPPPNTSGAVGIYSVRNLVVVGTREEVETTEACELFPDSPRDGCDFLLTREGPLVQLAGPYPSKDAANDALCQAIVPGSVGLYDQLPGLFVVALEFDGGDYALNRIDGCAAFDDAPTASPPASPTPSVPPSPSPTPESTNLALGAPADSPDTDPNFPEPLGVDERAETSWFSLGPGADGETTYTIHLAQPSTLTKVEFIGNRRHETVEFREDFGFASWTIELKGADGSTLLIIESSNDPEADQTAQFAAVPGVTEVLWTGQGSEDPNCGGFGDIKLFGFPTPA